MFTFPRAAAFVPAIGSFCRNNLRWDVRFGESGAAVAGHYRFLWFVRCCRFGGGDGPDARVRAGTARSCRERAFSAAVSYAACCVNFLRTSTCLGTAHKRAGGRWGGTGMAGAGFVAANRHQPSLLLILPGLPAPAAYIHRWRTHSSAAAALLAAATAAY